MKNCFPNTHQKQKHTEFKLKNNTFFSRLFSTASYFFFHNFAFRDVEQNKKKTQNLTVGISQQHK